ncbi:MAG: TolC family protein [Prolixibacteraceae bacterium]
MKKLTIITLLLLAAVSHLLAQSSMDEVLVEVEKNNTTLSTLQKRMEAEKVGNKTTFNLENPAIEFNYLWGNPSAIGNRTDFSISQSIDFPSAYVYKKQISELKNDQLLFEFEKQKREVLLQTQLICTDLIHSNTLIEELRKRVEQAKKIAIAYQSQLKAGECNQLEFNKVQMHLHNVENEMELLKMKQENSLAELALLNGGITINFNLSTYSTKTVPADFEVWYQLAEQQNPLLQWLKQELAINEKQVQLSKALKLPKLQAGYMSEKVVGEQFQGIAFGVTVPLWENKNRVKYAQLNSMAIESTQNDQQIQFYGKLKLLHSRANALQENLTSYRESFNSYNNTHLLQIAFEKGEISLIEYLFESSLNYENINRIFELELELNKVLAELNQYL